MITIIRSYDWSKLRKFWSQIKDGNTPGWANGKALEYLLVRAFDLDGCNKKACYEEYRKYYMDMNVCDGSSFLMRERRTIYGFMIG